MLSSPPSTLRKILIVDDEENVRHMLGLVLGRAGYATTAVVSVDAALAALAAERHDLVLTDLRMPRRSGLELVREVKERHPEVYVLLMTAYGSMDLAIEAMGLGAYDYISKPFKPDEILLALRKVEEREGLLRENQRLRAQVASAEPLDGLVGSSAGMREIGRLARRFAPHKTTVLLTGESGTGKDVLARGIHALSDRRDRPFVAVNCAAIPEALLESELFGHVRGAFTGAVRNKPGLFEEAHTGTLFLDETGELPLSLQSKLLRAIETDEVRPVGGNQPVTVDVRILCATSRDLQAEVAAGRFREDLFYRINVLSLHLPPLRERREDIPALVEHFVARSAERAGRPPPTPSRQTLKRLLDHPWPGNVRELQHAIERAVILSDGPTIEVDDLPPALARGEVVPPEEEGLSIKEGTRRLETRLISRALAETGGNRTQAAMLLEISHRTLLYKLKEYGLDGRP